MKYLVITMRGPEFDPAAIPLHYDFLDDLQARGLLEQAGPFTDRTGGAYVLRASCQEDARLLAEADPLHTMSCSTITVYEWDAK